MHVLFINNSLCFGGAEKQVISLINRMDPRRYAVAVRYLKNDPALLGQLDPSCCTGGIECMGVTMGVDWSVVRRLRALIDAQTIDVVICTNMYALLYGWLARRGARRKVHLVEVFHTTDLASPKARVSMMVYRHIVRMSELLVYVFKGQARHWRQRGLRPHQETVIYNGVDTKRFADVWSAEEKLAVRRQYGIQGSDYVVGLCAVLRAEKAPGDLLAAVARLRSEGVRIQCLFIGDGPERGRLEATSAELKLTDCTHITGLLQDVRPVIAACDVMAITSHAVETFSIAALEAMALGKPMIMTDIGGAREQVRDGENGLVYPAGDINALAHCLRVMADPSVRGAAGSKALALVHEAFDVEHMARDYERKLAQLVAGVSVHAQP